MVSNLNMAMHYCGLKDDTKPTSGVPNGSDFLELDTGDVYFYDADENGSGWTKLFSVGGGSSSDDNGGGGDA